MANGRCCCGIFTFFVCAEGPRDPLLQSERTQGFAADPDYWKGEVFAYVGLPQNLKDLKAFSAISVRKLKAILSLMCLRRHMTTPGPNVNFAVFN